MSARQRAAHSVGVAGVEACELAAFEVPVSLPVAREAWLSGLDEQTLNKRFKAGGVTFCTLMPMRAIPFEAVCLLGMNDGDYPRSSPRSDFDLMGLPGQQRPGDRSRRDDDRQLMLEALLSARRVLYLSWAGRSARDNSEQPPSVLVSQLRDYLAAGWQGEVLGPRTTEHPLQPFSRRYFERAGRTGEARQDEGQGAAQAQDAGQPLFTHAREWRAAHAMATDTTAALPVSEAENFLNWLPLPPGEGEGLRSATAPEQPLTPALSPQGRGSKTSDGRESLTLSVFTPDENVPLTLAALTAFLKNPVKQFFRERLDVVFRDADEAAEDDESFGLDGLDEYTLLDEAIQAIAQHPHAAAADLRGRVAGQVARLQRAGRLPLAEPGSRSAHALAEALLPMLERWREVQAVYPQAVAKEPLRIAHDGIAFDDWLTGLQAGPGAAGEPGARVWLALTASRLCTRAARPAVRPEMLVAAWVLSLVASACGIPLHGVIVGRDATVTFGPLPADDAQAWLHTLLECWRDGMTAPLPLACKTALALVAGADASLAYEGNPRSPGEVEEACLARLFPDYETLCADGRFATLAQQIFGPMLEWTRSRVTVALHASHDLVGVAEGHHDD